MNAQPRWRRPPTERSGPDRGAGGFYRTADDPTMTLGGIPLNQTEDAVVAAVRLAYRVADAQIERSSRLAERLRQAGDAAVGTRSDRQALDATERLVFNAAMSGLGWLEGIAAEGDSPIKRLLAVQYRMLGAMLGLSGHAGARRDASAPESSSPDPAASAPAAPAPDARPRPASTPRGGSTPLPVRIVLASVSDRAVEVLAWEACVPRIKASVIFHHADVPAAAAGDVCPAGTFQRTDAVAELDIHVPAAVRPGRWRAAICDAARCQVGWMEIEV
jgi:hypothetical protein